MGNLRDDAGAYTMKLLIRCCILTISLSAWHYRRVALQPAYPPVALQRK